MSKAKRLTVLVLEHIKNNNGMSASVSAIANAIDKERYTWTSYSTFVAAVRTLKRNGDIKEDKGRYYITELLHS